MPKKAQQPRLVKVLSVYTADAITVQEKEATYMIRLSGIKVPDKADRYHPRKKISVGEQSMAYTAQYALGSLVLGHTVELRHIVETKDEVRAEVFLGPLNVNTWLINRRLAVHQHDKVPEDWVDYFNAGILQD